VGGKPTGKGRYQGEPLKLNLTIWEKLMDFSPLDTAHMRIPRIIHVKIIPED